MSNDSSSETTRASGSDHAAVFSPESETAAERERERKIRASPPSFGDGRVRAGIVYDDTYDGVSSNRRERARPLVARDR